MLLEEEKKDIYNQENNIFKSLFWAQLKNFPFPQMFFFKLHLSKWPFIYVPYKYATLKISELLFKLSDSFFSN